MDAGVYNTYHSSADYEMIKKYYVDVLTQRGWTVVKETAPQSVLMDYDGKELTLRKEDYASLLNIPAVIRLPGGGIIQSIFYG